MILNSFLAAMLSLLAMYSLYVGWQQRRLPWNLAGWSGMALSVYCWCLALGTEFGLTVGLCVPVIAVWAGIYFEASEQRTPSRRVKPAHQWQFSPRQLAINTAHALYVLPVQLFMCAIIVTAMAYQLPLSEPKQMAIGVLGMPVIWGVLTYWYMMSARKLTHIGVSIVVTGIASAWLFGGING